MSRRKSLYLLIPHVRPARLLGHRFASFAVCRRHSRAPVRGVLYGFIFVGSSSAVRQRAWPFTLPFPFEIGGARRAFSPPFGRQKTGNYCFWNMLTQTFNYEWRSTLLFRPGDIKCLENGCCQVIRDETNFRTAACKRLQVEAICFLQYRAH